jgi:hypothetical protein
MQTFFTAFVDPANLAGHISYVLLIVSVLMRKMHHLRMVAISAGVFSAAYYVKVGDPVSFFWESLFSLVNAVQLIILFIENRRGRFSVEEQSFIDTALRGLERIHARRLVRLGQWQDIDDGRVLIVEDTTPGQLFYVVNGSARIERHGRTIGMVGPGDFLGEMSYLTGKHATATVRAVTPMRCLVFDRNLLRAHLARHLEVRHALEAGFNRNLVDKLVKTSGSPGTAQPAG